jgi:hypothetical protein
MWGSWTLVPKDITPNGSAWSWLANHTLVYGYKENQMGFKKEGEIHSKLKLVVVMEIEGCLLQWAIEGCLFQRATKVTLNQARKPLLAFSSI